MYVEIDVPLRVNIFIWPIPLGGVARGRPTFTAFDRTPSRAKRPSGPVGFYRAIFKDHEVIGSATITQLSVGFQLGAQAFSQIIFFQNKNDLNRFTKGNFEFDASASAALVTEGANASADYSNGAAVFTFSKGGLMYEASIGGQKFTYEEY